MTLAIGTDLVEVTRVRRLLAEGHRFRRWFTGRETDYCEAKREPALHYAGRLAAKEAVVKALRVRWEAVPYAEIEIIQAGGEPPEVQLHGSVATIASGKGVSSISVSLSHGEQYATATALIASEQ